MSDAPAKPLVPWGLYNKDLTVALDLLDEPVNAHRADQAWPTIRRQLLHHGIDITDEQTQYVFFVAMKYAQISGSLTLKKLGADYGTVENWNGLNHGMQLEWLTRMLSSWDPEQRERATVPWPHNSNTQYQNTVPVDDGDGEEDDEDESGAVE